MANEISHSCLCAYFKAKEAADRALELVLGHGIDRVRITVELKCQSGLAPLNGEANGSPRKESFRHQIIRGRYCLIVPAAADEQSV